LFAFSRRSERERAGLIDWERNVNEKTTPNFCLWNLVIIYIIIKDGDVFALRERVRLRLVRGERHGLGRGYAAIRGGNRQVRFLLLCLLLLLRFCLLGRQIFSFVVREGKFYLYLLSSYSDTSSRLLTARIY